MKKSAFHWSAGGSIVVSNLFNDMPENLDRIRLYGSYADADSHFSVMNAFETGDGLPETIRSWEIGLELNFLKWFNLMATFYNVTDQALYYLFNLHGNTYTITTRNRGTEISLGFGKTWGIFSWGSRYSVTSGFNKIISMPEEYSAFRYHIYYDNLREIIQKGGQLGDIYSSKSLKTGPDGSISLDDRRRPIVEYRENTKIGNVLPKANMSWTNDFKIGNFSIGLDISARIGGVVVSATEAMLDSYGVSETTGAARDKGDIIIGGKTTVDPESWYTTVGGLYFVPQYYTYSATNVRIREASIGYTFPRKMLGDVCSLTIRLTGKNLCMLYCKAPFDPEVLSGTSYMERGLDVFMTPSTRSIGFNVSLTF